MQLLIQFAASRSQSRRGVREVQRSRERDCAGTDPDRLCARAVGEPRHLEGRDGDHAVAANR